MVSAGDVNTGSNTYLPFARVKPLTTGQYATRSITSVPGGQPILNLRAGYLLNADTNMTWSGAPTAPYWTGPLAATAQYLWFDCGVSPWATNKGAYPDLYWACDNGGGAHIFPNITRWDLSGSTEPIELYVR